MRVDYIALSKVWIDKLKETISEDSLPNAVYELTQQGWIHQRRQVPQMLREYCDSCQPLEDVSKENSGECKTTLVLAQTGCRYH